MLENGGVDSYTNAISDIYQDNFEEGIFTGKGIYDLNVFCKVMNKKIPENKVLSHDLLEGCILRCGLSSDIMLLDSFPTSYSAYITRMERWIRGDWQIISWLKKKYINKLSKYKIADNLRRSMVEVFAMLNLIFLCLTENLLPLIIIYVSITISTILDILNFIIFRKENIKTQKKFTKKIEGMTASIYRGLINIAALPHKAWVSLKAIIKTIYRINFSKEHLLEWTTAEEAERNHKNSLKSLYSNMMINVLFGILGIFLVFYKLITDTKTLNVLREIIIAINSIIWIFAPLVMWKISVTIKEKKSFDKLTNAEQEYLKRIAENTWKYFAEFMNKENNFLPPDNFQENRREKTVHRTSSTNIGLGILTLISAYDMKFITLEKLIACLENTIDTVQKLEKWNGHLYNWYDTRTLNPLVPRFISTVDSGNFIRIYVYFKRLFRREEKYSV